jgi:putative flippase GtrA
VSTPLRGHAFQFGKFALVGASGVIVNLLVFSLTLLIWLLVAGHIHSPHGLVHAARELLAKNTQGLPRIADYFANAAGFVVSVLTNYYLNRRWTFRSSGAVASELSKFVVVSVVAYCGQLAVFYALLTHAGLSRYPSQLVAIACVMPINFIANKLWSFRAP